MRRRQPREVWAKRVQRWLDSGQTAQKFAAKIGVNPNTLMYWKYQLTKDGVVAESDRRSRRRKTVSGSGKDATPKRPLQSQAAVEFVELPAVAQAGRVELHLRCGRRLVVPTTVSPGVVAQLADALERRT